MKLMVGELYDALLEAGASDDKARAAASAVAEYQQSISDIISELRLLKWMAAFNLALTVAVLFKLFT